MHCFEYPQLVSFLSALGRCGSGEFTVYQQEGRLNVWGVTHTGLLGDDCGGTAAFDSGDACASVYCDALGGWLITTEAPTCLPAVSSHPDPTLSHSPSPNLLDSLMTISKHAVDREEQEKGGWVGSRLVLVGSKGSWFGVVACVSLPHTLRIPDLLAVSVRTCVTLDCVVWSFSFLPRLAHRLMGHTLWLLPVEVQCAHCVCLRPTGRPFIWRASL
jgi:hypothetical protein